MDIKKLTIINVILAIAVVVLFIMHFACNKCSAPGTAHENADSDDTSMVMAAGDGRILKIGWANSDSVTKYYQLAKKFETTLLEQQAAAQAELEGMYQKYDKKKTALEKEAPILGQTELNMKIGELQQLEQQIMMKEQELQNQLMSQEYAANDSYLQLTQEFMQKIGDELGYDYIFSYRIGGQLIYTPKADDITAVLIKKLNEAYANHGE
ncbi:MAG: OmpH family outer membrane protein [Flavobacteriales bacterium]|nr:OmpH family outer membrane protein [Flavobacteriales bacterium]